MPRPRGIASIVPFPRSDPALLHDTSPICGSTSHSEEDVPERLIVFMNTLRWPSRSRRRLPRPEGAAEAGSVTVRGGRIRKSKDFTPKCLNYQQPNWMLCTMQLILGWYHPNHMSTLYISVIMMPICKIS